MPAPIRLAWCIDSLSIGGTELNAVRTLEALPPERFAITVFHLSARGPLLERYRALGVPLVHVGFRGGFWHPSAFAAGLAFLKHLRARRVEIVHSHDIYSNIFAVPWARLAGVRTVIASKRWYDAVPSGLHRRLNGWVSRRATAVLANSERVARSLREEDQVPATRVRVVPNFIDDAAFEEWPQSARVRWREQLGLPGNARVIGVVARLAAVKGLDTFLHALPRVLARHVDARAVVIGAGPELGMLVALLARLGLEGRVVFAGELPNRPNPHGLLDISVLPSLTEGFPNSIVEAMAAGRPVVASRVGGIPDAVRDGETGLLVEPGRADALADAILDLLNDPDRANAMGAQGRRRAAAEFHLDRVIPALVEWYGSLRG